MSHNQIVGARGEDAAAQWYVQNGYAILDRNWRPGPGSVNHRGELDLILKTGPTVVFCEVKTRTSNRFGTGASSVGYAKQQAVRRLATQWLRASGATYANMRFDVVVVDKNGTVTPYHSAF